MTRSDHSPDVQRVVITSSVAAVVDDAIPRPHTYVYRLVEANSQVRREG